MRRVTRGEFYKNIGPLNVAVTPTGEYPYKTIFKLQRGGEMGMIVDHECGSLLLQEYFLVDLELPRNPLPGTKGDE